MSLWRWWLRRQMRNPEECSHSWEAPLQTQDGEWVFWCIHCGLEEPVDEETRKELEEE